MKFDLIRRCRRFFRRRHWDQERARELEAYLEIETADNIARGMSPEQARRAAHLKLGNTARIREQIYRMNSLGWLETLWQDLRYGLRQLRRTSGFTAVAILTLALGIGANTAIFTLIDAVLLKMLPVQDPQQLVLLDWVLQGKQGSPMSALWGNDYKDQVGRTIGNSFTYPFYEQLLAQNQVFSEATALSARWSEWAVNFRGQPSRADGELVSGNFFSALGLRPIIGRALDPDDDQFAASPAAVLSYGYWERQFGRDPSVVGQKITVNNVVFTIIGVAPPEFYGIQPGRAVDLWLPLHTQPEVEPGWSPEQVERLSGGPFPIGSLFRRRDYWWLIVVGRLKPGVDAPKARADLEVLLHQSVAADKQSARKPEAFPQLGLESVSKGLDDLRREFSRPLFVLMTAVGLVLLIVCANVASLLLARAASRQKEFAVRLAMGAGRGRLVRQLLTESTLLAVMGGAVGMVFAFWATNLLVALIGHGNVGLSSWLHVTPNARALAFTSLISVLTGILFGLSPALRSTRVDLSPTLKEGRSVPLALARGGSAFRVGLGGALVMTQIALSLMLLVGAGLFVRTLVNLEEINLGFDQRNLLLFGIDPSKDGYTVERLEAFYQELTRKLQLLPGVQSVTISKYPLIGGGTDSQGTFIQGYAPPGQAHPLVLVNTHWVGPKFFETMRIPVLLGRTIGEADVQGAPKVAVVNKRFVKEFLRGGQPIGRRFGFHGPESSGDIEIVGVIGDAKYADLKSEVSPAIFIPYLQNDLSPPGAMHFELRTSGDPKMSIEEVRRVAAGMDPKAVLYDVKTQVEQINGTLQQERMFAQLTGLFSLLAAFLACVGIYGTMSFGVERRAHEIGVRMALGAERSDVLWLVVGQALKLALIGIAGGLAASLAVSRLVSAFLYGVRPNDPLTFMTAALSLTAAALLASYIPARRATRVDPVVALRYE